MPLQSFRWRPGLLAILVTFTLVSPASQAAPAVRSSTVTVHDRMPVARPDFPVPTDANMIFHIQRSTNSNTVVYTANIGANGRLDRKQPVNVFWRRFNTTGEKKALGFFERQMAYGVRARRSSTGDGYEIRFVALPGRLGILTQDADGTVELAFRMGDRTVRPIYAYVEVDETGLLPSVERVILHGIDLASGKALVETMVVSGGEIRN